MAPGIGSPKLDSPLIDTLLERRLQLFPNTTRLTSAGDHFELEIGGCKLSQLAEEYGTPLYLYDQATLDQAVETYRRALNRHYPAESGLTYAAKAYLCHAIAQWAKNESLWLDCTGANELAIATSSTVRHQQLLVHGVNKGQLDLEMAVAHAGTIVVDNLIELERLDDLFKKTSERFPDLWLRLRPGLVTDTHKHIETSSTGSKFGISFFEAENAIKKCLNQNLPLNGLHFHLGSQIRDPSPIVTALNWALDFMRTIWDRYQWTPTIFSPGGGWGVAYHESQLPHPSIDFYVRQVAETLSGGCEQRDLALPRLQLEPGRSLIARAGVALYRVGAVKYSEERHWILLDGGLADNPRPALYQARYSALPVVQPDRPSLNDDWLGGPFCESGDFLASELSLPDLEPGELLAVPVCGAYQLSLSSNYNGALRPAVVWLDNGQSHLIQRRESLSDLTRRDLPLPG